MANITKYTSQSLTSKLTNLQTGNHVTSAYYWADKSFGQFGTLSAPTFIEKGTTYNINIQNLPPGTTNVTYTISAKAVYDNGEVSNTATSTVQVLQAARLKSISNQTIWVGQTVDYSYSFEQTPYNKGVSITASTGAATSSSKSPSTEANFVTVSGIKSGTSNITFTPADNVGNSRTVTTTVKQYVSAITISESAIRVNKNGNATIYVGVRATNQNDANATQNIANAKVEHTFSGTAEGSTSAATVITAAKTSNPSASTGTAITLTNVTKAGNLVITSPSGVGGPSDISTMIVITIGEISVNFYSDSACSNSCKISYINPGDHCWLKVSGGSGIGSIETTNISMDNLSSSAISLTGISNGNTPGIVHISVPNTATNNSSFKITVKPHDGGTAADATMIVKTIGVTLS